MRLRFKHEELLTSRGEAKVSRRQLAGLSGVSEDTVYRLEVRKLRNPGLDTISDIVAGLAAAGVERRPLDFLEEVPGGVAKPVPA